MNKSYLAISIIVILILFMPSTFFVYGVPSTPGIFSKESRPYGQPYTEWMIKWWQWQISLPREGHPYITQNIQNCPVGIAGPVAFLTQSIQVDPLFNSLVSMSSSGNRLIRVFIQYSFLRIEVRTGERSGDMTGASIISN